MIRVLIAATILATTSAAAQAQPVRCNWSQKSTCNLGKGCEPGSVGSSFITLDPQSRDYRRCDSKGCDTYQANVNRSGIFAIYDLAGRGVFAKVGNDGTASEVVSLGNTVIVYQGICR